MSDTSAFFDNTSRDVPRDQWGRYKLPDADGTTSGWTRATTFAEALTEQFGLSIYQQNQVVLGLGRRPDLLSLASTIDPKDKKALGEIRKSAHEAAATDAKANRGTAIHAACALAERRMPGVGVFPPDPLTGVPLEFQGHVIGYLNALAEAGLRIDPHYVECTVIVPDYHVAGTADNFVLCPDGRYRVLDKKTGNLDYAAIEFAVQLALYANAKAIRDYDNNRYLPMPENLATDYGIIAHIDPDTGLTELYRVNIAWGWMVARLCAEVRDARQQKHVLTPYVVDVGLTAPEPQQVPAPGSVYITGPTMADVHVVPVLGPSPIQQATATAVDSFWDLPHEDDEDDQVYGEPALPPFVAPVSPSLSAAAVPPPAPVPVVPAGSGAESPKFFTDPNAPVVITGQSGVMTDALPLLPADADLGAASTEAVDVESAAEDVVKRCKSKARVQQFARDVMRESAVRSGLVINEGSDDGIKLNQQQIKVARAAVVMAAKWGVELEPLLPAGKPRRGAVAEEPAPDLKLKMIRTAPTHQTLIEYRERLTADGTWTDDYQSAAAVRWAEIEQRAAEVVQTDEQGRAPLTPDEMIAGATSPDTIQRAWRRVTGDGADLAAWAPFGAAAEAKMAELNAPS